MIYDFKKILVSIVLILSLTTTSVTAFGVGENYFTNPNCYDDTHQFMDKYHNLLTPLYDMAVGWFMWGKKGIIAGGVLGVLDESLVTLGFTDNHYLTWGMFGATTAKIMELGKTGEVTGAIVGAIAPTGVISQKSELIKPMIAPVASAVAGNTMFKTPGMMVGGIAGALDELLVKTDQLDKRSFVLVSVGFALADKILDNVHAKKELKPILIFFVAPILSTVGAKYESSIIEGISKSIEKGKKLYDAYTKFIPAEHLKSHFEEKFVNTVGSYLATHSLALKEIEYGRGIMDAVSLFGKDDGTTASFGKFALQYAIFVIPLYVLENYLCSNFATYYDNRLKCAIQDQAWSEIYSGEVISRIKDRNAISLMDTMFDDVSVMISCSSYIEDSVVGGFAMGVTGCKNLGSRSFIILAGTFLSSHLSSKVATFLESKRASYDNKLKQLNSKKQDNLKHFQEGAGLIIGKDAVPAELEYSNAINKDIRMYSGKQGSWDRTKNTWMLFHNLGTFVSDAGFIYIGLALEGLDTADLNMVRNARNGAKQLFELPGTISSTMVSMESPLDNFIALEGIVHSTPNNTDLIEHKSSSGDNLSLKNLEINQNEHILLKLHGEVQLNLGEIYAITGSDKKAISGLFSKIIKTKENNIRGVGEIYYPEINGGKPKIILLEREFFPLNSSLQKIIMYPEKVPSDPLLNSEQRNKMTDLLKEIEFSDDLNLDRQEKEWINRLTNEDVKKIGIVSAIIKKPDILLLDGAFDGLSKQEVLNAQQMLKKYLPKALILVMEQNSSEAAYHEFYDHELSVSNTGTTLTEI